jgi:hypothetical protein
VSSFCFLKGETKIVLLNEGTANEVALRVVLDSEPTGREYFDEYDSVEELIQAAERLVKNACKLAVHDGIERIISVALVPKANYGDMSGYGFGLGSPED